MGDHHNGQARFVLSFEQFKDLPASFLIQIAGGFVGQQDPGPIEKRSGDRHSLAFSTGEFPRTVIEPVIKPEAAQQGSCSITVCSNPRAHQARKQGVFQNSQFRKQVIELEDESDVPISIPVTVASSELGNGPPIESDVAPTGIGRVQSAQKMQQRAFT